jgi:hypothetical protein
MAFREVTVIETKGVLRLRRSGVAKKRIAAQLGVDVKTVRGYLKAAEKLGLVSDPRPTRFSQDLPSGTLCRLVGMSGGPDLHHGMSVGPLAKPERTKHQRSRAMGQPTYPRPRILTSLALLFRSARPFSREDLPLCRTLPGGLGRKAEKKQRDDRSRPREANGVHRTATQGVQHPRPAVKLRCTLPPAAGRPEAACSQHETALRSPRRW